MRANRRDRCHRLATPEDKSAHTAGGDTHSLAIDQVRHGGHIDPPALDRVDRAPSGRTTHRGGGGGLHHPAKQASGDGARGQAKTCHQGGPSREPRLVRGRLEGLLEALAKRRVHELRTLPGRDQSGGGGDRRLLVGVPAAQFQAAPTQEVGDDLVDSVFGFVHSIFTLAAARRARSCMTLTAPTVECISAATSLSEYPWRKRSSSTRR